jgi:DNA mismatch repair protein MutS2
LWGVCAPDTAWMAAINTTARAQDQFKSLDDMMDPERDELGAGTHAPAQVAPDAYPLELLMEHTLAPLRAGEDVPTDLPSWEEEAPWEAIRIPAKTLDDLEWSQLLEHLAYGTVSSQGRELAFGLRPLPNRAAVERRMREISESQALLDQSDAPPLRGMSDMRRALAHVVRQGVLGGEDLWAIARNCDVASRGARFYSHRASRIPYLASAATSLDPCDELRSTLNMAVEPDGKLSDKASPDLGRLRRQVQQQHDRLRGKLDAMMRDPELDNHLRDDYFTVREDRYVVPVRVSSKSAVGGIVHGYSSSGQTAYVEPAEIVELNNQLRWAQIELAEEEARILRRLSGMVASAAPALKRNEDVLAYLDYLSACGQLCWRLRATEPTLTDGELLLKQARHPLLYLKFARRVDGQDVNATIANDVMLGDPAKVLVVSGPNTGGKTVFVKTLGLCALMVRCGLPTPTEPGSKLPLFRAIYTDIGDEQSIERDLSTFSGHLVNINQFVDDCDASSLVLLDELFTGTDPMQGAALAVALLEELAQRGTRTLVTTHLESLKTLALQQSVYANASMGFDIEALAPTYRVTYGLPGSSYAVRIAERLGFPRRIVDRARLVLETQEQHSIEEVLSTLDDKMQEIHKEQRRLESARRDAEQARDRFQKKYEKLLTQEREAIHEQVRKVKGDLDRARQLIKGKIQELNQPAPDAKRATTKQELELMRRELADTAEAIEAARDFASPPEAGPGGLIRVEPQEIVAGLELYAHTFKRKGQVLEYTQGGRDAILQLGALKAKVAVADLYFPSDSARRAHVRGGVSAPASGGQASVQVEVKSEAVLLPQTGANTADLRGMRADEALEKLDLFLDAAFAAHIDAVYVIHGHGTGALKRAVRGWLPSSPYIASFRRGEHGEGGDGVTIAFLRR